MSGAQRAARPPLDRQTRIAILALGATQIIGWGSSYYLLSVLGAAIGRDLDLSPELVFSGVSLTLVASGLLGPRFGRLIDRNGAARAMAAGSLLLAAGLVALALARGPATYLAAWSLIGIATPLCLYQAAFTGLTQIAGPGARRAITFLTFLGGLASTIFWPLSGLLLETIDWRGTCLVYAALNALVCAPLHLATLRPKAGAAAVSGAGPTAAVPAAGALAPSAHGAAFLAFAIMLALNGFVFNAMSLHILPILQGIGFAPATAILVGTLIGIAQVLGRMGEMALGDRYHPIGTAMVSALLLPLPFALLAFGAPAFAAGLGYALFYGVSNGLLTIARGTVTLHLFGARGYGERLGRLTVAQSVLGAVAPIVMARIIGEGSAQAGLATAGVVSLLALGAMIALCVVARRGGAL